MFRLKWLGSTPADDSKHQLNAASSALAALLTQRRDRIVCAESCTGGQITQALTAIDGASSWFERGFITYSVESKIEMLGIDEAAIRYFGVVSERIADNMAQGALNFSHADWAVATTGVAGPQGGSPETPVGTVCFAWASNVSKVRTTTKQFAGDRHAVQQQASIFALQTLMTYILQNGY